LAFELSTRYAPYADWQAVVDVELLGELSVARYWRSAEAIRVERGADALPLAGLHLALDPGHIGGVWAETEGRRFRIAEGDYLVMEGELVLEVAQRVREQLLALGAEVTLLRETNEPVNPKGPLDYLQQARQEVAPPTVRSWRALWDYGLALRARAIHLTVITGDLAERARLVNMKIQPDAVISLHINAAPWPKGVASSSGKVESETGGKVESVKAIWLSAFSPQPLVFQELRLVRSNHLHVLIFGCLSGAELQSEGQQAQLATKLLNGSGSEELLLGGALANALARATVLPAAGYDGLNAILLDSHNPYLLARNLMLLRMMECPVVLLEPYVANSEVAYARIQSALANRAQGLPLAGDDILVEYADGVVAGVRDWAAGGVAEL
jgi:hypothetical protein